MRRSAPAPRHPRSPAADSAAVAERRNRAIEEPLDVRLRSARPYPLLEVRNPIRGTGYLVMLPEFPGRSVALCTCTDFARRGLGTCKHIEAGVRWLAEHPGETPLRPEGTGPRSSALWKKVDQRLAVSRKDPTPPSRRWRRAGALLFEDAVDR
ncbi:MAG: hypothetical protein ACREDE_04230 [Thermoplasmata archaeon]